MPRYRYTEHHIHDACGGQGCRHPVHGEETIRPKKETIHHDPPKIIDTPYGSIEVEKETRKYAKCQVCGFILEGSETP